MRDVLRRYILRPWLSHENIYLIANDQNLENKIAIEKTNLRVYVWIHNPL